MKNGFVLLAVVLSVTAFGGMMRIKTDVQQLVRERQRLANEQLQLRETKRVLEAEYAMLANPVRLLELAKRRGFHEMTMAQVAPLVPPGVRAPAPAVVSAAGGPR